MIAQPYRLGGTPQNVNLFISGWQDNGCNLWNATNWTRVYGADGMEAAIDYTNQNTMYESYQNGGLQRSFNGGVSWSYIAPASGDWLRTVREHHKTTSEAHRPPATPICRATDAAKDAATRPGTEYPTYKRR